MDMKPIETIYAGHRFRSRLEARWAVFFDKLGIKWEYEPQGYEVNGRPYLPDFRLPEMQAFVEVKGDPKRLDAKLMVDLTRSYRGELFTLILGNIPEMGLGKVPVHTLMMPSFDIHYGQETGHFQMANRAFAAIEKLEDEEDKRAVREFISHEGRLQVACYRAFFLGGKSGGWSFMPIGASNVQLSVEELVEPGTVWVVLPQPELEAAYTAARQARFEHGETPKPASDED